MSNFLDKYEISVYMIIISIFLLFGIGFTYALVGQQQTLAKMAATKESISNMETTDKILISAALNQNCSDRTFSIEFRQSNSKDIRVLEAAVQSQFGKVLAEIPKNRGDFNSETEFILRGNGFLTKKKSLNNTPILDFGVLTGGDLNKDAQINQKDIILMNQKIKAKAKIDPLYDLNCDGKIDNQDGELLKASVGKVSD